MPYMHCFPRKVWCQSSFSCPGTQVPVLATMMSLGMALVFPVLMLGALWTLELDGIWLNFVGVNILGASLGGILLLGVLREIRKRERAKQQPQES